MNKFLGIGIAGALAFGINSRETHAMRLYRKGSAINAIVGLPSTHETCGGTMRFYSKQM